MQRRGRKTAGTEKKLLFAAVFGNASLRRDRKQRVGKLRENRAEQIQLIVGQPAGDRVGGGGNGGCQFTCIQRKLTPVTL